MVHKRQIKLLKHLFSIGFKIIFISLIAFILFYGISRNAGLGNIKTGAPLRGIETKLSEMIERHGANVAMDWVRNSFAAKNINLLECRKLAYLIGYQSINYPGDTKDASNKPHNDCEKGYELGIETARIINSKKPEGLVFQYIETNLHQLIEENDVDAITGLLRLELKQANINMFDCHSLAHETGHHAAQEHIEHIELHLSTENINFCGSGFVHGIEDGLASSESPSFKNNMYKVCQTIFSYLEYPGCYHGAGHAFMKKYRDVNIALGLCDSLIYNNDIKPGTCYRGVFSQNVNKMKKIGTDNLVLIDFCASLPSDKMSLCAAELNGFNLSNRSTIEEIESALQLCILPQYPILLRTICLENVAWTAADLIIAKQKHIAAPSFITDLPQELKKAYIKGTARSLKRMVFNGIKGNFSDFCKSLKENKDESFCRSHLF